MMRPTALLFLLLVVSGCDRLDPYQRDGVWRPNGANADNLRAMVAVPADLVAARPGAPANGGLAADALTRLRQDRVRPLPDSAVAQVLPISIAAPAQPAAPAAAGTGN
jgi:type IV pilus biogenesis protein CpaD/CtpE